MRKYKQVKQTYTKREFLKRCKELLFILPSLYLPMGNSKRIGGLERFEGLESNIGNIDKKILYSNESNKSRINLIKNIRLNLCPQMIPLYSIKVTDDVYQETLGVILKKEELKKDDSLVGDIGVNGSNSGCLGYIISLQEVLRINESCNYKYKFFDVKKQNEILDIWEIDKNGINGNYYIFNEAQNPDYKIPFLCYTFRVNENDYFQVYYDKEFSLVHLDSDSELEIVSEGVFDNFRDLKFNESCIFNFIYDGSFKSVDQTILNYVINKIDNNLNQVAKTIGANYYLLKNLPTLDNQIMPDSALIDDNPRKILLENLQTSNLMK